MTPEITLPDAAEPTLDAPIWRVVVTDLAGTEIGEVVDAYERKPHFALHTPETLTLKLGLNNPLLDDLLAAPQMHLFKVYRRTKLMMVAETSTWEFATTEDGLTYCAFVATSCFWPRIAKRMIGRSTAGLSFEGTRLNLVLNELNALNATDDTGIRPGNMYGGTGVTISGWRWKPFLEAIQELAFTVNGFDFYTTPAEPDTGVVGHFHAMPRYGGAATDAIFEYGTGRANLRSWNWKGDNTNRINQAFALPTGYPDNQGLAEVANWDSTSIAAINLREELVNSDVADPAVRQTLVDEHVRLRTNARQIFTFDPHYDDGSGRVPQFGQDFGIGDTITGRINDNGYVALNGQVRLYAVDIEIDDEGRDTVTFTTVPEA